MALKDLGMCDVCCQRIYENESGSITGHLPNCPNK